MITNNHTHHRRRMMASRLDLPRLFTLPHGPFPSRATIALTCSAVVSNAGMAKTSPPTRPGLVAWVLRIGVA
jgi:hypothetical protein